MPMSPRAIHQVLLTAALAVVFTASGFGGFAESFKAGIRAWDYKDWPEVVAAMRQSIAEKPAATGDYIRIYGTRLVPYIPHYFLGLGLYRQGDYAGARQAFAQAKAQGHVKGVYRSRMELFQAVCSKALERMSVPQGPAAPPATGNSRPALIPGGASAPHPPSPPRRPVLPDPLPPTPKGVHQKALEEVTREARQSILRGRKLLDELEQRRQSDPQRAVEVEVAGERLRTAEFQLRGCLIEGDLAGAEKARDDLQAACELLDEAAKGL
jgi:hypothetical protein